MESKEITAAMTYASGPWLVQISVACTRAKGWIRWPARRR